MGYNLSNSIKRGCACALDCRASNFGVLLCIVLDNDASIIFLRKALIRISRLSSDPRQAAPDSSRGAAARTPRRTAAGPPGWGWGCWCTGVAATQPHRPSCGALCPGSGSPLDTWKFIYEDVFPFGISMNKFNEAVSLKNKPPPLLLYNLEGVYVYVCVCVCYIPVPYLDPPSLADRSV